MEKKGAGRLYLIRHGQSHWNKSGRFTGWVDIALSQKGIEEAIEAGRLFSKENARIDCCYVSSLSRSLVTAQLFLAYAQEERDSIMIADTEHSRYLSEDCIALYQRAQINERCYGSLQGGSKEEAKKLFGAETVQKWRRSYEGVPPEGESLKQTAQRVLGFFREEVLPKVQRGEQVLICAHGNSLRALVMEIEALTPEEIVKIEIPTAKVVAYEYLGATKAAAPHVYPSGFSRVESLGCSKG